MCHRLDRVRQTGFPSERLTIQRSRLPPWPRSNTMSVSEGHCIMNGLASRVMIDLGGESSFRSFTNRSTPSVPSRRESNATRLPSGENTALWTQFSSPSGIYIDANHLIYVAEATSNPTSNPGWEQGIRIGDSTKGWVTAFIPSPNPPNESRAAPKELPQMPRATYTERKPGPRRMCAAPMRFRSTS